MDLIEDIRRARLQELIKEYGSVAALAQRLDRQPAQVSQWKNASIDAKSRKPRYMKSETARRIEALTGKPDGWMDQPVQSRFTAKQDRSNYDGDASIILTFEEKLLLDWFRSKSPNERKAALSLLNISDRKDFSESA